MCFRRVIGLLAIASCWSWPTLAQVQWATELPSSTGPIKLQDQNVVGAPDGSVYIAATINDGEMDRLRFAKLSATGAVQWVRYVTGLSIASLNPVLVHADASTTVAVNANGKLCVVNFLASGSERSRNCFAEPLRAAVARAADDDVFVSTDSGQTVRKVATDGSVRWTRAESVFSNDLHSHGVDSNGNYYEVRNGRLKRWSATDGSKLSDVTTEAPFYADDQTWNQRSLALPNGELVLARYGENGGASYGVVVGRFASDGTELWRYNIGMSVPGGYRDAMTLAAGDGGSIYVAYGRSSGAGVFVVKLAANGTLLWHTQHASARRYIDAGGSLLAVSSAAYPGQNGSDSIVYPVAASNGDLQAPSFTYTRGDFFVPREWFAVNGGVAAVFFDYNPVNPNYVYPAALEATTLYFPPSPAARWAAMATSVTATFAGQGECLMPRLVPADAARTAWWVRTEVPSPPGKNVADWTKVRNADGVALGRTPATATGCGVPLTLDGGRVIANNWTAPRAKRVAADGTTLWETPSSVYPLMDVSQQPVHLQAAGDDSIYAVGSLVGRVSASGNIAFETETGNGTTRYLAPDATGNTWAIGFYEYQEPMLVQKLSPAGTILWSLPINVPQCSDYLRAATTTPNNELLVATQSCGEARVHKVSAGGQLLWQRVVSGTSMRPVTQLNSLSVDASGNVIAGGCTWNSNSSGLWRNGAALLASWTASGSERWTAVADLFGGIPECVTSVAADSAGNVFAAASYTSAAGTDIGAAPARQAALWSLDSAGAERWQHRGVLSAPSAEVAELAFDDQDRLIVLGETPADGTTSRKGNLRRINTANLGSPLTIKFLEVPTGPVAYRDLFAVRIGLRTTGGAVANAAAPLTVRVGMVAGSGALAGSLACTIAAGSSECVVGDLRYDKVEQGLVLSAAADGFASTTSPAIAFATASTSTTLTVLSLPPHVAYSWVRIRAAVQGPPPPSADYAGNVLGPWTNAYTPSRNCVEASKAEALPVRDCELLLRKASMPVTASFYANTNYLESTATPLTLTLEKSASTLQVAADPTNSNVAGDRLRFRVALLAASGASAAYSAVTIDGGTCPSYVERGTAIDGYAGSYYVCEIASPAAGPLNATVRFAGNDDLLPATSVTVTTNITNGSVVRGTDYPSGVTAICSTAPGTTCTLDSQNPYEWRCAGPAGATGDIFFIPGTAGGYYNYPGTPIRYRNLTGVLSVPRPSVGLQFYGCKPDVDGDGAVMAMTDGIVALRRMLGMTGDPLTLGATHSCVPTAGRAYAGSFPLTGYDLDGDGQTLAATDGVLLLRFLLGLRGTALVAGAVGVGATRATSASILSFIGSDCGLNTN